jgi:hypothetical protein
MRKIIGVATVLSLALAVMAGVGANTAQASDFCYTGWQQTGQNVHVETFMMVDGGVAQSLVVTTTYTCDMDGQTLTCVSRDGGPEACSY